ncbi:22987_t:CDS:2, partial [Gigaspora rosea]
TIQRAQFNGPSKQSSWSNLNIKNQILAVTVYIFKISSTLPREYKRSIGYRE